VRWVAGAARVGRSVVDLQRSALAFVLLCLAGVVVFAAGGAGAQVSTEPSPVSAPGVLGGPKTARGEAVGAERTDLRTATSRTYEGEGGALVARVFSGSVNFRAADGSWQAIDNRLVQAPGGLRNAANRYGLELPSDIGSGPVRVREGGDWVSFALRGAQAPVSASGAAATYTDSLPGVDVVYEAGADAVKEELVLAGRESARSFVFDVQASAGLSPRLLGSGAIGFEDASGAERMALAAPFMVDAAGQRSAEVRSALARTDAGWRLELAADDAWLEDPARQWPVTVDPTVYPSNDRDCYVENASGSENSSFCASSNLEVGYGSGSGAAHDNRALLKFNVAAGMPEDAEVLAASLRLWLSGRSTTTSKAISAHRVTKPWTGAASWNKYDGTNAWASAGGDFEPAESQTTVGATGAWYAWNLRELTEQWIRGTANHGLLLKDVDGSVNNRLLFNASEAASIQPVLEVQYLRRIGERRSYTFERFQLTDRMSAAVNPANGNLMFRQTDLAVAGAPGPDLVVARTYNSFGGAIFDSFRPDYGDRWEIDTAHDFRLQVPDVAGDVFFQGPSGYIVRFERQVGGSYKTPAGFSATLVRNSSDGTFTLTEHASQTKHDFASDGRLLRQKDPTAARSALPTSGAIRVCTRSPTPRAARRSCSTAATARPRR
jgi:hypothetical protein